MLLLLITMFITIMLIGYGLRGKQIDDHKICNKCGYDLEGLDHPTNGYCPECAANTRAINSIRIGHWKKNRWLLATGVCFAMLSGSLVAIEFNAWFSRDNRLKPFSLLLFQTHATGPTRFGIWFELSRRYEEKELSKNQELKLIKLAITNHSDHTKPWIALITGIAADAMKRSLLTPEQRRQLIVSSVFPLELKQKTIRVVRGDLLPYPFYDPFKKDIFGSYPMTRLPFGHEVITTHAVLEASMDRISLGLSISIQPTRTHARKATRFESEFVSLKQAGVTSVPAPPGFAIIDAEPGIYTVKLNARQWIIDASDLSSKPLTRDSTHVFAIEVVERSEDDLVTKP